MEDAIAQIKSYMDKAGVDKVFVATDGIDGEREQLREVFKKQIFFFDPTAEEEKKYKKGGVAIIDQIICSHAKFFVGSKESTFTFRIQEEREIMGFKAETTYKR